MQEARPADVFGQYDVWDYEDTGNSREYKMSFVCQSKQNGGAFKGLSDSEFQWTASKSMLVGRKLGDTEKYYSYSSSPTLTVGVC